jgi:hypothetical protein
MYITSHIVENEEDRRRILEAFPALGGIDLGNVELFAVSQADENIIACALASPVSDRGSRLAGLCLLSPQSHDPVAVDLFDYLAWELRDRGKAFLVVDPADASLIFPDLFEDIGCDPAVRTVFRLDWLPA